jgi:uncharacterized alpha-E superfamily protein
VALDPNNPRSVAYQLARIETHGGAVEAQHGEPLVAAEQIAIALATQFRTTEADGIDEAMLLRRKTR